MLLGELLYKLYKFDRRSFRAVILRLIEKVERGSLYSQTLRRIFRDYHAVEIGMYTHGSCFVPGNFDRNTTIGRYCSIAADVQVFNRNHPMNFKSTHAFFFNPVLELTDQNLVEYQPLEIGNDVWIGHGTIILPNVTKICDGAVIGAGSIVSKNIPPYAVAVGHPIRIVRYRFSQEIIAHLLEEKWWTKSIQEVKENLEEYTRPYVTGVSLPYQGGKEQVLNRQ